MEIVWSSFSRALNSLLILYLNIVKLQVSGLRLGVDFTFTLDNKNKNKNNNNKNNHNDNHNNPHLDFL